MTEKPLAFLSLVKVLESAVGFRTKYTLLEPFQCVTMVDGGPAYIPIQNAAKLIAQHVGLRDLMFVISVTTQDPTTAGHIELRYDAPEVFIEISQKICMYKDAVLATLCHEVAHKFLHENGIRHGNTQKEQEFLTDVAAVYLGMGKIMLNGCECQSSYSRTERNKTTTTTETLKIGYISRQCFAFVYRLICEMRQIPSRQFLSGLCEPARDAVLACEYEYRNWFVPEYHNSEGISGLAANLKEDILSHQEYLAARDYQLRRVEDKLQTLHSSLGASHKLLLQATRSIGPLGRPSDNPHLRYLTCIEAREGVADLTVSSRRAMEDLMVDWNKVQSLGGSQQSPDLDTEVVECPIDRIKLRVPSGRARLLVTCSECGYKFIVKTMHGPESEVTIKKRPGLLKSLRAVFGRR